MRKYFFILLYIFFIMYLFDLPTFKTSENITYYSDITPSELKEIEIYGDEISIDIIPGDFDEISIKRSTTKGMENNIEYSSNYIDGKLKITQFIKGDYLKNIRDEILIQIPYETKLNKLNIEIKNGSVNLDGINSKNTNIKSNKNLNLFINSSIFQNINIDTLEINSVINNTYIQDEIIYTINDGKVENINLIGNKETLINNSMLEYRSINSNLNETTFENEQVEIYFEMLPTKNYTFKTVGNKLYYQYLEELGTDYTYKGNESSIDKYIVNVNKNNLVEVTIGEKEFINEKDKDEIKE